MGTASGPRVDHGAWLSVMSVIGIQLVGRVIVGRVIVGRVIVTGTK